MKVNNISINDVKTKIASLKGKKVLMAVNKGRKHIVKFNAEVIATFPFVFTVEAEEPCTVKTQSFAYAEIMCGNVKILPATSN